MDTFKYLLLEMEELSKVATKKNMYLYYILKEVERGNKNYHWKSLKNYISGCLKVCNNIFKHGIHSK